MKKILQLDIFSCKRNTRLIDLVFSLPKSGHGGRAAPADARGRGRMQGLSGEDAASASAAAAATPDYFETHSQQTQLWG